MGECNNETNTKKRNRAELETGPDSPESKRACHNSGLDPAQSVRVGTETSEFSLPESECARASSESCLLEIGRVESEESEFHSPGLLAITDDILDILDESGTASGRVDPETQDLDSVIKSFEEEILQPTPAPASDSGELVYLLEASDDELGLPPVMSSPSEELPNTHFGYVSKIPSDAFGEIVGVENNMVPSYDDSFGYDEFTEEAEIRNNGIGLFGNWEGSDFTELWWRQESLSAL